MKIELKNKIEAILFLEAEPVVISKLAENLKITVEECQKELENLETNYSSINSALSLVFKKDEVQLVAASKLAPFLKEYFKSEKSEQLSPAMLEVLSIIIYKGPIAKVFVEQIRGVNCDLILRKLTIRGLVDKVARLDNSRIFVYEPSLKLLKKLGISRLEDLPKYSKLSKELRNYSKTI